MIFTATAADGTVSTRRHASATYTHAVVGNCKHTFHESREAAETRAAKVNAKQATGAAHYATITAEVVPVVAR